MVGLIVAVFLLGSNLLPESVPDTAKVPGATPADAAPTGTGSRSDELDGRQPASEPQWVHGEGWHVFVEPPWRITNRDLSPNGGLITVFTASTGPLVEGGSRCAHMPVATMEALQPTDALVHLERRSRLDAVGPATQLMDGFEIPPAQPRSTEAEACVSSPDRFEFHWITQSAGPTDLYWLVIIGDSVNPSRRATVERIVDSFTVEATEVTGGEQVLIDNLTSFARDRSPTTFERLIFGPEAPALALADRVVSEVFAPRLEDPANWVLPADQEAGWPETVSALDLLARDLPHLISAGPYRPCPDPSGLEVLYEPVQGPADLSRLRSIVVQPDPGAIDTCYDWWAIEVYLTPDGRIAGIGIQLWLP